MIRRLALFGLLGVIGSVAFVDSAEACHRRGCGHRMRSSCYSTSHASGCYSSYGGGQGSYGGGCYSSYSQPYPSQYVSVGQPAPSAQNWSAPSPQAGAWQPAPNKIPPAPMMAPSNRSLMPTPAPAPAAAMSTPSYGTSAFSNSPAPAPALPAAPAGGAPGAVPPPPPAPPNF